MARSAGFKINRHLRNLLDDIMQPENHIDAIIYEIRAITGKYQPLVEIQSDLVELLAMDEAQLQQAQQDDPNLEAPESENN